MSAEKEIRDEKFRQWKRDLMARVPEDSPRVEAKPKAPGQGTHLTSAPSVTTRRSIYSDQLAAANDIRWLGEVPKVRPRIVCASCGLIMTHMGVHERLVHYNEEIKRLLDKLGNKQ